MDKDERKLMDNEIAVRLFEALKPFDTVLCYVSSDIEVDTRKVLKSLLENGDKRVLFLGDKVLPYCIQKLPSNNDFKFNDHCDANIIKAELSPQELLINHPCLSFRHLPLQVQMHFQLPA